MAYNVIVSSDAHQDINDASNYYDQKIKDGLEEEIDRILDSINFLNKEISKSK